MLKPRIIWANFGMPQEDAETRDSPMKLSILRRYEVVSSIYFPCSSPMYM